MRSKIILANFSFSLFREKNKICTSLYLKEKKNVLRISHVANAYARKCVSVYNIYSLFTRASCNRIFNALYINTSPENVPRIPLLTQLMTYKEEVFALAMIWSHN